MIEPLHLSFDVACSADHAFAVWTSQIGSWWPVSHTVAAEKGLAVVLEQGVGGRIFERTEGGSEHEWGEVTVWEPPNRLGYLWHLRRDRGDATGVEIRFIRVDEKATRVEIEHTGWERLGEGGQDWRDRNRSGWGGLLPHFIAAAEGR